MLNSACFIAAAVPAGRHQLPTISTEYPCSCRIFAEPALFRQICFHHAGFRMFLRIASARGPAGTDQDRIREGTGCRGCGAATPDEILCHCAIFQPAAEDEKSGCRNASARSAGRSPPGNGSFRTGSTYKEAQVQEQRQNFYHRITSYGRKQPLSLHDWFYFIRSQASGQVPCFSGTKKQIQRSETGTNEPVSRFPSGSVFHDYFADKTTQF